jgi:peroxiredoxin
MDVMNERNGSKKIFLLILATGMLMAGCSPASAPKTVKSGGLGVGDKATDFSLLDAEGHSIKLSDVQPGWSLVLFFYRGHWCEACLNQMLNLKRDEPKFTALKASLAAVSVDTVEESAAWNKQWRFPFPLLSDTKLELIKAYGALDFKGHDGKDISHPAVIIIDAQKTVWFKYVGTKATDRPDDDEVLYEVQKLQQTAGNAK